MMQAREIIFIVDDNWVNLKFATQILYNEYAVHTALSGEELFDMLGDVTPSLILLDIVMPGEDGYAIIKKLKSDSKNAHIPVIFMTGADDDESEVRGLRAGAVDYITKPLTPDILKMRVDLHILLHRQKRELQEAVINAEVASNAKSAFIAVMSHEMRTPLNAIIGFSELSLEIEGLGEELYSNLANISSAGTTLLSIISDILDISKIETGKFELIPIEYDTAALISSTMNQSIMHRGDKPIALILEISDDFPKKLYGDELRVKQMLNNLLSNALKYTTEGEVKLSASCEIGAGRDCWLSIAITDTGVGIREKDMASVFDDYVQADMTAHRKIVGTGLGLSVTRRLARMMNGDIDLESEYGKGSTFTARFKQRLVSDEKICAEDVKNLKIFRYSEQKRRISDNLPKLSLPDTHVLVVDDVPVNLAIAVGLLKRYSIKTDCLASGPEAIEAIMNADIKYDIIFMDHMMPGMDGIEAVQKIREIDSDYAKNIPIIAFTANAIVGNEEMFLENGFQAFISKPIEMPSLDAIIREWVWKDGNQPDDTLFVSSSNTSKPFPSVIKGIDLNKGLKRFDGDTETYLDVLRKFSQNVPSMTDKVVKVTESGLKDYTIIVHGIKGSCFGICADETAVLAEALEAAAKKGDYDFVTENNAAFLVSVRGLLENINLALGEMAGDKQEILEKPDEGLLERLLDSCLRHDMNDIDNIVAKLDTYTYESGGELVQWLREMADEMNYNEIAERLAEDY